MIQKMKKYNKEYQKRKAEKSIKIMGILEI
jgi:hypothetical protein